MVKRSEMKQTIASAQRGGRPAKRTPFVCRTCGGVSFYSDAENVRHCIPCENLKEQRQKAKAARWEKKRPKRDRRAYRAAYYERTGR